VGKLAVAGGAPMNRCLILVLVTGLAGAVSPGLRAEVVSPHDTNQQSQGAGRPIPEAEYGVGGPVSPDGRYLAFRTDSEPGRQRGGLRDLAIREIGTNTVRTIAAHKGTDRIPSNDPVVWPPDSGRVAYAWCDGMRGGPSPFPCEVRISGIDGSAPRMVVPRTTRRFSCITGRRMAARSSQPSAARAEWS
jgi:hypothetical protein